MAECFECGAKFKDGGFPQGHRADCSRGGKAVAAIPQTKNKGKESEFLDRWPGEYPPPETEYRFHESRRWRFDFAWPEHWVAVEVDGNAWHVKGGGGHMQDKDLEKLNMAQSLGWTVFRFSPKMLRLEGDRWMGLVKDYLDAQP